MQLLNRLVGLRDLREATGLSMQELGSLPAHLVQQLCEVQKGAFQAIEARRTAQRQADAAMEAARRMTH